jgi:hypothetical protein
MRKEWRDKNGREREEEIWKRVEKKIVDSTGFSSCDLMCPKIMNHSHTMKLRTERMLREHLEGEVPERL